MGKRKANRRKGDKYKGKKQVHVDWNATTIPQDNQIFKAYYKMQFHDLSQQQFQIFWQHMKIKLPVVFRVNPNYPNYRAFCDKIQSQDFLKTIIPFQEIEKQALQANQPTQMPKLKKIDFYPGDITFELSTSKQMFKKSKILSQFHKYLQKSFDAGLISRQELVSMLPPLYLNLNQNDVVLDMCAAPGSKTSQMLQIMTGQSKKLIKGCIIANDADYSRAQMLIHQIQRAGTAGILAVNHPGQFLPEIWAKKTQNNNIKQKFQFNKILCDVPCSGDGATRKIPTKWAKWHTSDGMVLHPLQLAILIKSINLLKKGGLLVYSTCSLNPIQNQAVVSALMQKVECGLQLIDIHPMYKVKGRRGMLSWKICSVADKKKQEKMNNKKKSHNNSENKMQEQPKQQQQIKQKQQKIQEQQNPNNNSNNSGSNKFLKIYNNWQEIKDNKYTKIKQTMFPLSQDQMKKINIHHTMRILPHDQNSGGFYVALFKKHDNFEWKYNIKKQKKEEQINKEEDQELENQRFLKQNMPDVKDQIINQDQIKQENQNSNENQQSQQQEQGSQEQQQKQEKIQNNNKKIEQKYDKKIQQKKNQKNNDKNKKQKGSKYDTYSQIQQEQFKSIQEFYGLQQEMRNLLYVRQAGTAKRKVLLITESLNKFLKTDVNKKMMVVNMGCTAFEKGKESFAGHHCLYRLTQQGIHFLLNYITKRKVKVPLSLFKKIIQTNQVPHQIIQQEDIKNQIKDLTQGSLVIYIDQQINGKRCVDAMVGQNFKSSFHIMVSKDDLASLAIRYL